MRSYEVVFPGNKKVDVRFKQYEIKTDQTRKNEGDETAPEPFDVFLSSLAACAGIYAKSFCDTREIDTAGMKIVQEVFAVKDQKLLDEIKITLYVNKAFPSKYKKPVLKAMDGCAVKNQLNPDIRVTTQIEELP